MGISFENPPLVELIAELRWGVPQLPLPAPVGITIQISGSQASASTGQEAFFDRFADAIASQGFGRAERLVPPGVPIVAFQPAYRFKKSSEKLATTVYQLGANVFSANVTPPYESWDAFRPTLKTGIDVLLETRAKEHQKSPFETAALRYINAFDSTLTQSRSTMEFISEVLGFTIDLPHSLNRIRSSTAPVEPVVRVTFDAQSEYTMSLSLANGFVNGKPAVIMDILVQAREPAPAERDRLLDIFEKAHDLIHDSFLEMTKEIYPLMKPRNLVSKV